MTSGTIFEQRRIILAQIKFSDNTGEKVRPIVVISNQKFNNLHEDIICCPVTSEIRGKGIKILNEKNYLEEGRLPEVSEIKSQYPLVISKKLCKEPITKAKITTSITNQIITDIKETLMIT